MLSHLFLYQSGGAASGSIAIATSESYSNYIELYAAEVLQ